MVRPSEKSSRPEPKGVRATELRQHLRVVHDRARDELREEGHEQGVVKKAGLVGAAAIDVDQIRDLLQREERDRERKDEPLGRDFGAAERVQVHDEEVEILEHAERQKVAHDAKRSEPPRHRHRAVGCDPPADRDADNIVEDHRPGDQQKVRRRSPGIEHQRHHHQPRDRRLVGARARHQEEHDQRKG